MSPQHQTEIAGYEKDVDHLTRRLARSKGRAIENDLKSGERLRRQRSEFAGVAKKKDNTIASLRKRLKRQEEEIKRLRGSRQRLRDERTRLKESGANTAAELLSVRSENQSQRQELQEVRKEADKIGMLRSELLRLQQVINEQSLLAAKEQTNHKKAIRKAQSEMYKNARSETKQRVMLESELESQRNDQEANEHAGDVIASSLLMRATRAEERCASLEFECVQLRRNFTATSRVADERALSLRKSESLLSSAKSEILNLQCKSNAQCLRRVQSSHFIYLYFCLLLGSLQTCTEQRDDLQKKLTRAEEALTTAAPRLKIGRQRHGNRGGRSWPHFMWEIMMEQLVNGTPPTAVNKNILTHVHHFSPECQVLELPSVWTIRRARSMLLVIVQTLSAYRLGVAKKWGQLLTDGTSRRQQTFQNLLISVEEDELFR